MTTYTPQSSLLTTDPLRVDTQAFSAYANRLGGARAAETREYVEAVVSGALQLSIDPVVCLAQWALETNWGRSEWWVRNLNSSGIGITGDPAQNAASQRWHTGTTSAYGHLAHLCAYIYGDSLIDYWPISWPDPSDVDKRLGAPIRAGYRATELDDLTNTWAIDNKYGQKLASRANDIVRDFGRGTYWETEAAVEPEGDDSMAMTFGRVPKPTMTVMIVSKPANTGSAYGYDYVPGGRNIIGLVHHETQGRGSGKFYHDFFSCPNGERCKNALVDFFIDRQGNIFQFNDPFGVRAGWANGGGVGQAGGLEGDGPAFYARFGAAGINNRLVSIEYESTDAEDFTAAQVQAGGSLAAWIHDRDGQPWDRHPFVPKYGCVTSFLHYEFGTTNCGKGELDDITKIQAVTKGIMRQYQEGGTGTPEQPQVPPQPAPAIPGGLTLAEATKRFGRVEKHTPDGKTVTGGFDPTGIISLAWAHRSAAEGIWPEIESWWELVDKSGDVRHLVVFANGWLFVKAAPRAAWTWADLQPVALKEAA